MIDCVSKGCIGFGGGGGGAEGFVIAETPRSATSPFNDTASSEE